MEQPESCYYSPRRVRDWLARWRELVELALPSVGSTSYLKDECEARRGVNRRSDPYRYADIEADITTAWASLGWLSLEYKTVEGVMQGYPLREIDAVYRLRHGTALQAYNRAVERMARKLGWRE